MSDGFLPYARQWIDETEIEAVIRVLRGDWLTTGPMIDAFEKALAESVGARFAVSCSSGSAALHLAMLAAEICEFDSVVVPTVTFVATANGARHVGADVVFADVEADTALMRADHFRKALDRSGGHRIKAVMPVHVAGQCADLEEIAAIATERDLMVIEDAAHAIGTTYQTAAGETVKVGSCRHSNMAVFSFHATKTITTGEGGAVTTNSESLYSRLRSIRSHGIVRDRGSLTNADLAFDTSGAVNPWYYEMTEPGYNYRITDIQCSLGLSQLDKLETFVEKREQLLQCYDERLDALSPVVRPLGRSACCRPAWHLCVVLIEFERAGASRARVMRHLREKGIGTQVHYIPVHEQPYYRRLYGAQHLPGAARYYARALTLPLFPKMAFDEVDRVVDALTDALDLAPHATRMEMRQ